MRKVRMITEKVCEWKYEREKNYYKEGLREDGCMGERKHDVRSLRKK